MHVEIHSCKRQLTRAQKLNRRALCALKRIESGYDRYVALDGTVMSKSPEWLREVIADLEEICK